MSKKRAKAIKKDAVSLFTQFGDVSIRERGSEGLGQNIYHGVTRIYRDLKKFHKENNGYKTIKVRNPANE